MTVRVSDFGLARDINMKGYYKIQNSSIQLPLKWMALESLATGQFSLKSDIVSIHVGKTRIQPILETTIFTFKYIRETK